MVIGASHKLLAAQSTVRGKGREVSKLSLYLRCFPGSSADIHREKNGAATREKVAKARALVAWLLFHLVQRPDEYGYAARRHGIEESAA